MQNFFPTFYYHRISHSLQNLFKSWTSSEHLSWVFSLIILGIKVYFTCLRCCSYDPANKHTSLDLSYWVKCHLGDRGRPKILFLVHDWLNPWMHRAYYRVKSCMWISCSRVSCTIFQLQITTLAKQICAITSLHNFTEWTWTNFFT